MALIDIDKLLSEISPDEPCGPDLEYDAEFIALLHDAEGSPPKYTPDGQLVEDGEDPNWREIRTRCVAMFDRTIDLRVALVLVNALMCDAGLPGLREGLELVSALVERHWDHFHPQLDPDDDLDPMMRMNLLSALAVPIGADGDPRRFQQRLRGIPLAESRQLGRFSLRDMLIASGELTPASGDGPNEGLIEGAFQDTDGDTLRETGRSAEACIEISKSLDQWVTNKVGASSACDLTSWHKALGDLNKRLAPRIEARFPGEITPDEAETPEGGGVQPDPGGGAPLTGAINSRDDVLRALQKVLEYYARHEPSSPIPLLIRRAQRLVTMGFVDIIRDLTPGALDQLRVIGGEDSLTSTPPAVSTPPPAPPVPASRPPQPPAPSPAPPPTTGGSEEPIRLGADFTPR